MSNPSQVVVREHNAAEAARLTPQLAAVWTNSYKGTAHEHDPWFSGEQFAARFTGDPDRAGSGYSNKSGFRLLAAWAGEEMVGFLYGFNLTPDNPWLAPVTPPLPASVVSEELDGSRTFGVADLIIAPAWRRQHLAQRLHDKLTDLPHERFALAVEPDNQPALAGYRKWGYQPVGASQSPGFPLYTIMVKDRAVNRGATPLPGQPRHLVDPATRRSAPEGRVTGKR